MLFNTSKTTDCNSEREGKQFQNNMCKIGNILSSAHCLEMKVANTHGNYYFHQKHKYICECNGTQTFFERCIINQSDNIITAQIRNECQ